MRGKLTATQIFLLYAIPSISCCVPTEKRANVKSRLEHALYHPDAISVDKIAEIFPMGFREYPDLRTNFTKQRVERYWEVEHNKLVKKMDGPEEVKRLCMTHRATISEIDLKKGILHTKKGEVIILPHYHCDAKVGDRITIHKAHLAVIK